ncbi:MAG TPA: PrsW family glutamic-type intramembrane protease [Trebonia sp.]|nr:PrsW family glutamic-type intramembrane protease [Trebonia sp.]
MDTFGAGSQGPQPGRDYPPPTQSDAGGAELRLSLDGKDLTARGQAVRVGRSPDNDLVTEAPTVSRHHAVLRQGTAGWEFENVGSAPTFLNGREVTRLAVDRPLALVLGSVDGPVLRAEPPRTRETPESAGAAGRPGPPAAGGPGWGVAPPVVAPAHHAVAHVDDEIATALHILFPLHSWLHNSGWRQGLRLLVIAYALLPLIFLAVLSSSNDLSAPGWAYSLYIAPLWIMGFWLLIRPGHLTRRELYAAVGIVAWTLIWINLVTININDRLHLSGSIAFLPALAVGFNEEITKALPVLLAGLILLKYRKVKLSVRMSMFLGTIAGLTFGVAEQAFYTSNDIIGINQAQSNNEAVNAALAFAERIFVDGFQHAVWAGIVGFFIGLALNYPRRRIQLIVLGVTIAAVLHALNDFLAGSSIWLVIIVQAASLLLFLGYTMSEASIEQQVRDSPLFRGDSMVIQAFRDPAEPPHGSSP